MTNLSNQPQIIPTAEILNGYRNAASEAFKNLKRNAVVSAANCFLFYWHTASDQADPMTREWLEAQIDARNEEIDRHNVNADDASKLMRVEAREGAHEKTRIVKFVFGFDRAVHASNVSRYAAVVGYIEANITSLNDMSVDAVVEFLESVGGFEAALDAARGGGNSDTTGDDKGQHGDEEENKSGGDTAAERKAQVEILKRIVAEAPSVSAAGYVPKFPNGETIFFAARSVGGAIELVAELDLSESAAEALLLKVDDDLLPHDRTIEFVAQVVNLGTLVADGGDGNVTVDGTQSGEVEKIRRTVSIFSPEADATPIAQVSSKFTDASVVVEATPKDGVYIGDAGIYPFVALEAEANKPGFKELAATLKSPAKRVGLTLGVTKDPIGAINWTFGSSSPHAASTTFTLRPVVNQDHCPIKVDDFKETFAVDLTKIQVVEAFEQFLKKWDDVMAGQKKPTFLPVNLGCDGVAVTLEHAKVGTHTINVSGQKSPKLKVSLKPRDLYKLFSKLRVQRESTFRLKGNPDSLFVVEWEDTYGAYKAYLPVVDPKSGHMKEKGLAHFRPAL